MCSAPRPVCTESYEAARKGTVTFTLVPCPGSLSNSNVPPSCSTRSRILISPRPPDFPIWSAVQPTPSSDTERPTRPLDRAQPNLNVLCVRIFGSIAKCFLSDAVDTQRGPRGQLLYSLVSFTRHWQAAYLAELFAIRTTGLPAGPPPAAMQDEVHAICDEYPFRSG